MNRWTHGVSLAALGLCLATVSAGCFHGDRRWRRHSDAEAIARRIDLAFDHLDLTEAQRATLEPIVREMVAELTELRQRARRLRADTVAQWEAQVLDVAEMHRRIDAETEALRATLHQLVDQVATVHGTLEPEQREEIANAASRHRRWHRR